MVPPEPPRPTEPLPAAPDWLLPPPPLVGALVPAVQAASATAAAKIESNGRICNSTASLLRA
jgi:hypothetical protein